MRAEWKCKASAEQIQGSALPRKTSKLQHSVDRTANRHRCSGRVAQGERVRDPQGTRQKSDRKLAIWSACQCFALTAEQRRTNAEQRGRNAQHFFCDSLRHVCDSLRPMRSIGRSQLKFIKRLFTKNTAPCKLVRGSIGGDA